MFSKNTCPNCLTMYRGKQCPNCNYVNDNVSEKSIKDWFAIKNNTIGRKDFILRNILITFFMFVLLISFDVIKELIIRIVYLTNAATCIVPLIETILLLLSFVVILIALCGSYALTTQRSRDIWGERNIIYFVYFIFTILSPFYVGIIGWLYLLFKKGKNTVQ